MSDQPVTPDREALGRAVAEHLDGLFPAIRLYRGGYGPLGRVCVDALLPLLTEALDRARQQGRDDAALAILEGATDRPAMWAVRLARGGPNRKDEE